MLWYRCKFLLIILSLNQSIETICADFVKESFCHDWAVNGDKIVYSRNLNRHHEFGFANCETLKKSCEITLVSGESTQFSLKTCKFTFDPSFVSISSIAIPDADKKTDRLALLWLGKTRNGRYSSFVSYVNIEKCEKSESYPTGADMRFLSTNDLLLYKYPIFITIDAGSSTDRSVAGFSFESNVYPEIKVASLFVNHTWIGKMQPLEIDSTRGFFYIGTYDENESLTKIEYANITSKTITSLATISHSEVGLQANPETSGAHDRYGLCWNAKKNKEIICTQLKHDGYMIIHRVTMRLTEAADWIGVHNLEDDAVLVATGTCPRDNCSEFKVQKISATGQKSLRFTVDELDLECPPSSITVDIAENADKNQICFNIVCLEENKEQAFKKKFRGFLQYRSKCISNVVM